uniref:Uncharacterized protein n=1 Tax=Timema douglasi TaxID=61478 RepID=A0A7R8VXW0_TIMDO|nr:unnamed protein product [Timema douglasi]
MEAEMRPTQCTNLIADCKRSTAEISPQNFPWLRKVTSGSHGNHPATYAELRGVAEPACHCQRLLTYARIISRVDAIMCNMLLTYLGQADTMLHRYLYLFKATQLFEFLEQVVKDFIKNQQPIIPPINQKPEDDGPEVSTDSGVFVFSMLAQLLTGEILGLEREECTEPIGNEIPVIIPVPSLNNPLPLTIKQMLLLTPLDQYSNNFTTSSNNKPSTESNENISMSNTAKPELEAFYSGNRHQPVMNHAPSNNQLYHQYCGTRVYMLRPWLSVTMILPKLIQSTLDNSDNPDKIVYSNTSRTLAGWRCYRSSLMQGAGAGLPPLPSQPRTYGTVYR